ncbi:MAG: hypothetical protein ACFN02_11415 [Olsenella profusa]
MSNMRREHGRVLLALVLCAVVVLGAIFVRLLITEGGEDSMETTMRIGSTDGQTNEFEGFALLGRGVGDYDYDFKLAKERGICSRDDGPDLGYLELQGKYDRALSLYLEQALDMQSLDAELEVRGIPGYDVRSGDPARTLCEWFRSRSHLSSPYLYLRSNLRIERLSEEDIEALRTESLDTDEGRQALAVLAARTYQELTSYEGEHVWQSSSGVALTWYYDVGSGNVKDDLADPAPARCLVLWLTFQDGRLSDESLSVEERNEIYERDDTEWHFYIQNEVIPAYAKKFSDILGYPVKIFLHDNPTTT